MMILRLLLLIPDTKIHQWIASINCYVCESRWFSVFSCHTVSFLLKLLTHQWAVLLNWVTHVSSTQEITNLSENVHKPKKWTLAEFCCTSSEDNKKSSKGSSASNLFYSFKVNHWHLKDKLFRFGLGWQFTCSPLCVKNTSVTCFSFFL